MKIPMKIRNNKDLVRDMNKNTEGRIYIESKMNYHRTLPRPNKDDLRLEAQTAQYKMEELSRKLILKL